MRSVSVVPCGECFISMSAALDLCMWSCSVLPCGGGIYLHVCSCRPLRSGQFSLGGGVYLHVCSCRPLRSGSVLPQWGCLSACVQL